MSYVVLQPNSSTNQSDKYQVVKHSDWLAYLNEWAQTIPAESFDTFAEAAAAADTANASERRSESGGM